MKKTELAGNLDTQLLKIAAFLCMIIDHAGVRIFPQIMELRIIGRIAFPLYIWCMVAGACFTRCPWKYAMRLFLVGLVAQPCFILGLKHDWEHWNVFFTLFLGYLGIWGIRENRWGSRYWAPVAAVIAASVVQMDYGWKGVMLILLMYLARRERGSIIAVMIAFCLYWGANTYAVTGFFGFSLKGGLFDWEITKAFLRIQTLALLALPLILWQRPQSWPFPKFWGYLAYPGHLLILWGIQLALGMVTLEGSLKLLFPWT